MLIVGEVWTFDGDRPRAGAVYLEGGRVADVGEAEALRARYPGARRLSFERVTPGLHDAHVHPLYWGEALAALDLRDERDPRRVAAAVRAEAARRPRGSWIRGGGYAFDAYPDRVLLDEAAPDHPVFLESRDLHSAWANAATLAAAGVDARTPDPPGGRILRRADGEPAGYLLEHAVELVRRALPPPTADDLRRGLDDLARRGYVAAHAMGDLPPEATEWVRRMAVGGALPLRLAWTLPKRVWRSWRPEKIEEQLHVFGVKFFADGALTSRTAWMKSPYPEGSRGMPLDDPRAYDEEVAAVLEAGFEAVWHAIGTRAVHELLNLADRLEARGLPARARLRIEHAQHVVDTDLPRLAGRTLSMQPWHAHDDRAALEALGGEPRRTAYRWAEFARLPGVRLLFGSDAPVAVPDAVAGLQAATRHPLGRAGLTEEAALAAYVHTPAVVLGWYEEPAFWGRIAPGARAALTLWDANRPVARVWQSRIEEAATS